MHSPKIFKEIIIQVNPVADFALIEKAREYAEKIHQKQKRKTGEPYITHPLMVTQYLLQQGIGDTASICACLLHDCVEDGDITIHDIEDNFGKEIASIVEGLTKVERTAQLKNYEAANLKKIVIAAAKDARVIIIKLCDILHNLNTIEGLSKEKQQRFASIALHVYAPIAEKIGLYRLKGEIEEKSFVILEPDISKYIDKRIIATREEREANTDKFIRIISEEFKEQQIEARIVGRAKYLYSVFQKMHKHNKSIDQIYDFYGVRIVTTSQDNCYKIHSILCNLWDQVPKRYKDFIRKPKLNGYQSLHDNFLVDGKVVEVQIRSEDMNNEAEFGAAIHWQYKQTERDKKFDKKMQQMKEMISWKTETEQINTDKFAFDAFKDQIVVITPKGDPIILKEKATALDFAFDVHTRVGTHAKSALINGEHKSLSTELKSGDIVNIIQAQNPTINANWLKYVATKEARAKIRAALQMTKKAHVKKDTALIDNEISELSHLEVYGVKLPIHISKCCKPKQGDRIVAYYTKDRKRITIHTEQCSNRFMIDQKRKVKVTWQEPEKKNIINISCEDVPGNLIKVLNAIGRLSIEIESVQSKATKNSLLITVFCKETITRQARKTIISDLKEISSFVSIET